MGLKRCCFLVLLFTTTCLGRLPAQALGPTSGEITVQLTQGLDSATNPRAMSEGRVTKSTNPAVPVGSSALMELKSDSINGGYTVTLQRLGINGQMVPAASSDVVAAPDFFNKAQERLRAQGQPQDSVKGTRVFLPQRMIVRFILAAPVAEVAKQPQHREDARPSSATGPKDWVLDTLPEVGATGQDVRQAAAILEGTSTIKGRTSKAFLVMHCDFPTTDYPSLLPLEAILGGTDEMLDAPGAPGQPVDVSAFALSTLGGAGPVPVNAIGQNRTTGARIRFFYEASAINQIVNAQEEVLRLALSSGQASVPDEVVATFKLPVSNTAVKNKMTPCLATRIAQAEAQEAKKIAFCPAKADMLLTNADLSYTSSGKSVKTDNYNEMDGGASWKLPAPTAAHPSRGLVLTCMYSSASNNSGQQTPAKDVTVKVPVPASARYCEWQVHKNDALTTAFCTK